MDQKSYNSVGAVIIGRNEGERLKLCISSVKAQLDTIVYVDSGSTDGSAEYAEAAGVTVVRLDMSIPFNAGRARNEGFNRLTEIVLAKEYIQFIDGDCELCPGWIDEGRTYFDRNDSYAVVTGRVKERHPEASIYNWLCDLEWQGSTGDVRSCGGIFMIRSRAFSEAAGCNETMVAGEEPEMCYRLRQAGWKIHSLPIQMTLHDAAMTRFYQWWKRTVRSGLAYAHGFYLHRKDRSPHHLPENRRILVWAFLVPIITCIAIALLGPLGISVLILYPFQLIRQYYKAYISTSDRKKAWFYAIFNTIEKFPQFIGQTLFIRRLILAEKPKIIEYK